MQLAQQSMITLKRLIGAAINWQLSVFPAIGGETQETLLEASLLIHALGEIVLDGWVLPEIAQP